MFRPMALVVVLAVVCAACEVQSAPGDPTPAPTLGDRTGEPTVEPTPLAVAGQPDLECQWAQVGSVTDGDTIQVLLFDGDRDTVRYMGVDTPEVQHPTRGLQPFGPEASAYNAELVGDAVVCLEPGLTDRDDFGRLLRYVWLPDGRFVNEELLRAGLAQASTYPPDVKYVESHYLPAQQEALEAGRGIWVDIDLDAGCDPAYPAVCIPPPPPDLDCADVEVRRFVVLPPDPHRFDSDGNGYGCES